ncbi:MAG: hypothetical protein JWM98_1332 [Thermoleophilia bacterium]|nr:hypothetical protein [Thermoleophilia bacterium]
MRLATMPDTAARLDELGRTALVRLDYRPIPAPGGPRPMSKVASAFPTWDAATIDAAAELGWDEFWAQRPAGAGRLVPVAASGYDDAVRAARAIALTTRPGMADGDKQAQAVLQLADGGWYVASLGGLAPDGVQSAWLLRLGSFPGYWQPTATALVPELQAVVGGASTIDLRHPR